MGIVAGLGLLFGVNVGRDGQWVLGVALLAILMLIAILTGDVAKRYLFLFSVALTFGIAAGDLRAIDGPEVPSTAIRDGTIAIEVVDDPRVAGRGWMARAAILPDSGQGVTHDVFAYFPRSLRPSPGMKLLTMGELPSDRPNLYFIETGRVVERESSLERIRQRIRTWLEVRIQEAATGSGGTIALGLLIGDDSALTTSERDELRRSGLSHITAVSGWNVTVIVGLIAVTFRSLGKTGGWWLLPQIVGIGGYVWLVGLEPPIIRAAIMGSLALVAIVPGRPVHMLSLLAMSAGIMAAIDPEILASLSFQLSFLSMVGLVMAAQLNPLDIGVRQAALNVVLVPVMAGVMTAPLVAARFGIFSTLGVPANIIVAPLTTPLAAAGAATALTAPIWPLSALPGAMAWVLGTLILMVAELSNELPFGVLEFRPLAAETVIGIYLGLLAVLSPLIAELRWCIQVGEEQIRQEPQRALVCCSSAAVVLLVGAIVTG